MRTCEVEETALKDLSHIYGSARALDSREVDKQYLVNKINYINFQEERVIARFKHRKFGRSFSMEMKPEPCLGDTLSVLWAEESDNPVDLDLFDLQDIIIRDTGCILVIPAGDAEAGEEGFDLVLPERAPVFSDRHTNRMNALTIGATVMQNGSLFNGNLVDFSATAFRTDLSAVPPATFKWFNPDAPATVTLVKNSQVLFSGECALVRTNGGNNTKTCVFTPQRTNVNRYKAKDFRGKRYPPPTPVYITFIHPLSGRNVELPISDISGSGFAVSEQEQSSVLIPGLIIPELNIVLPGGNEYPCTGQVIHKKEQGKGYISGVAILDMKPEYHTRLLYFLHQEQNSNSFLCASVDLDELWSFFFESGFIYPEKYGHMLQHKNVIKETYRKLYTEHPGIARHFIYQDNGRIEGHMSMLRSYENSWLLHHHAASRNNNHNAGLQVLNQVGSFGNNSHRIYSMHMDYLMCYFRWKNKFPKKVFGDIADKIDDPRICSLDTMAYFHLENGRRGNRLPDDGWNLERTTATDLQDLGSVYAGASGGLMLKAFNLDNGIPENEHLKEAFQQAGFLRSISLYSVKHENNLKAVIMADRSDTGMNMSDLLNCIKVFITDGATLPQEILYSALQMVSREFGQSSTPVLLFPEHYMQSRNLDFEKSYTLWIINMEESDHYFKHLKELLRTAVH